MPKSAVVLTRSRGVVYTQSWTADLMLDLVGYTEQQDLGADTIVEPGCGNGAILTRVVSRLIASASQRNRDFGALVDAIRAYDIDITALAEARMKVKSQLVVAGASDKVANYLVQSWIVEADFLLDDLDVEARWVVGNPPYVRVEEADAAKYAKYRSRWSTMSGRADIYIGFYQAALALLKDGGALCFICADRWMHNQYGTALRKHVIDHFALSLLLEVHESAVFDAKVAAYPAITLMERKEHGTTALATAGSTFGANASTRFLAWWSGDRTQPVTDGAFTAATMEGRFRAESSWPSGPPERLQLVADLEQRFPSLADVGIVVGVGIATGADRVYVVKGDLDVEPEFVKKAIGPADIRDGRIVWGGRHLVSPWSDGELVDLTEYPKLKRYFTSKAAVLKARYVATRNKNAWWRTIDRPVADEYRAPKLVVADINDRIEPVLDRKGYWPLHSVYIITSSKWDLEVLGGYLLSDVAAAFVEAYSVKMANGHLRVSAQYLKRIRLPRYEALREEDKEQLAQSFRDRDRVKASLVVRRIVASKL